jgi:hypothetical protein
MADVSSDIVKQLWNATDHSTWESLIGGLNEIYELDVITTDQYEDLEYAINKLNNLETDFPDSPGELSRLLDPYM